MENMAAAISDSERAVRSNSSAPPRTKAALDRVTDTSAKEGVSSPPLDPLGRTELDEEDFLQKNDLSRPLFSLKRPPARDRTMESPSPTSTRPPPPCLRSSRMSSSNFFSMARRSACILARILSFRLRCRSRLRAFLTDLTMSSWAMREETVDVSANDGRFASVPETRVSSSEHSSSSSS